MKRLPTLIDVMKAQEPAQDHDQWGIDHGPPPDTEGQAMEKSGWVDHSDGGDIEAFKGHLEKAGPYVGTNGGKSEELLKAEKSGGLAELAEHLEKAKYIKRTGSPGNYKYEYETPSGKKVSAESRGAVTAKEGERKQAEVKHKRGFSFRIPGTQMSISAQPDPERKDIGRYRHYRLHVVGTNQLRTGDQLTIVTEGGKVMGESFKQDKKGKGKGVPSGAIQPILRAFIKEHGKVQAARGPKAKTEKSMDGIDALDEHLEKACDGKCGDCPEMKKADCKMEKKCDEKSCEGCPKMKKAACGDTSRSLEKAAIRGTPIGSKTPSGKYIRTGQKEYTPIAEYKLGVRGKGHAEIAAKVKAGIEQSADICKVSPPVCKDNLGIERKDMPQISGDTEANFIQSYKDKGIKTEKKTVAVGRLKATQKEINAGKAAGMAQSWKEKKPDPRTGKPFDPRKGNILVSSDGHIVDGHHRFAAALMVDPAAQMDVTVIDVPIRQLLADAMKFPGVKTADFSAKSDMNPGKKLKDDADVATMKKGGLDDLAEHLEKALPSETADISPEKARKILHDGEVGGKPLTEQQRKFFGAIASKGKQMKKSAIDTLGEHLEKSMVGGYGLDWANRMGGSPFEVEALQCLKKITEIQREREKAEKKYHKSYSEKRRMEPVARAKYRVMEDKMYEKYHAQEDVERAKQAEIERKYLDWRIEQAGLSKSDDGKPGKSLGETSTAELQKTLKELKHMKGKSPDAGLDKRIAAVDGELKKRGGTEDSMSKSDIPTGQPTGMPTGTEAGAACSENGGPLAGVGKPTGSPAPTERASDEGAPKPKPVDWSLEEDALRVFGGLGGTVPMSKSIEKDRASWEARLRKGEDDVQPEMTARVTSVGLRKGGLNEMDPRNARISQDKLCKGCGSSHSAMLSSCPNCGAGATGQESLAKSNPSVILEDPRGAPILQAPRVEKDISF